MGGRGGGVEIGCLSMHQPWASLLVHGIKRIEGRSWPSPLTGELWIHAASKVPDPATIKIMEDYYREIYAVNGITDLKFPEHYPVSQLLGCVKVVGCVKSEELAYWDDVPQSVRLEALTDFCWLCEEPKKLAIPLEMRGYKGVYDLDRKMYEVAVRGLSQVDPPQPVHFPLPNPQNLLSLKPGSLLPNLPCLKTSEPDKSPSLTAAITAARAAATQFSKREVKNQSNTFQERRNFDSSSRRHSDTRYTGKYELSNKNFQQRPRERGSFHNYEQNTKMYDSSSRYSEFTENVRKSTVKLHPQTQEGESVSSYNVANTRSFHSSSGDQSESKFTEANRNPIRISQVRSQEQQPVPNYKEKHTHTFDPSSGHLENKFTEDRKSLQWRPKVRDLVHGYKGQSAVVEANSSSFNQAPRGNLNLQSADSKDDCFIHQTRLVYRVPTSESSTRYVWLSYLHAIHLIQSSELDVVEPEMLVLKPPNVKRTPGRS